MTDLHIIVYPRWGTADVLAKTPAALAWLRDFISVPVSEGYPVTIDADAVQEYVSAAQDAGLEVEG